MSTTTTAARVTCPPWCTAHQERDYHSHLTEPDRTIVSHQGVLFAHRLELDDPTADARLSVVVSAIEDVPVHEYDFPAHLSVRVAPLWGGEFGATFALEPAKAEQMAQALTQGAALVREAQA